jgi:predicted Ser/Thr protein kinase
MTPEDYARARALFDKAMDLPESERRSFVDRNTPIEDPLRSELLAMIDAGEDTSFLATTIREQMLQGVNGTGHDPLFQIGNYKVLRELGRGGMGVVYLALRNDDVFHKIVALKVIGDGRTPASPDFVQRFRQERQILAGLDHPNIARILDGGNTDDGRPFYVMEYVAGSPIDEYCTRMSVDVPTRVRMITEVCAAVGYLHGHAIAHRDIKPTNVLVTPEGRVKLVDFGVAKVETVDGIVASPSSPGHATMIMTPGYASPEQLSGDPAGKSGDIYSIGVVLYQLLTGRLPYADKDGRPNLAAQLSGGDPKPPSQSITTRARGAAPKGEGRRTSPPDLDRVVLTALQRDPLRRYATVQLFEEDLHRCLDGRPIVARAESWMYRFRKLVARNQVAAALVVLLFLVGGAAAWMAVGSRIERAQLEGKEAEIERLVGLLNGRVARWLEVDVVAEKVADVQVAGQLMASDTLRAVSLRAPDPARVKRVVTELGRVLDRADELSRDLPPVRKEIASVYRQIGDFESKTPRAQITDPVRATASYRRAADVAASIRSAEPEWAARQLAELGGRLEELGSHLDVAAEAPVEEAPQATPPPARRARPDAPGPRRSEVNQEEKAELSLRLRTTIASASRAHESVAALRRSLAAQGQTVRADISTTLTLVDSLIDDARGELAADDLPAAEETLRRAAIELKKLFQSVGG